MRGSEGARLGLLFGPEKAGLKNEELVLADAIVRIPLNPAFASLNLAQAVLIMAYEWRLGSGPHEEEQEPEPPEPTGKRPGPATKEEILHFFRHLEGALDDRDFFPTPEMRPKMVQNMRTMFERVSLTRQDVQTLRGVVRALTGEPLPAARTDRTPAPIDTEPSAAIVRAARRRRHAATHAILPPARAR